MDKQQALRSISMARGLHQAGNLIDAIELYQAVLSSDPENADVLRFLGIAELQRGNQDDGITLLGRSLKINPQQPDIHYNLGYAFQQLKRSSEALFHYTKAIELKPDYTIAYINRGVTLFDMKRYDEALSNYDKAVSLDPNEVEAYNNRGFTFQQLRRFDEALTNIDKAVQLMPNHALAHYNRANTLLEMKRYEDAVASYDKALALNPDAPYARGNLLHARMYLCDWQGIDAEFAALAKDIAAGKEAASPFTALMTPLSPALQRQCAEITVKHRYPAAEPLWKGEKYAHERIRVGYFSSHFRNHPMAYLMAKFFELHDRTKFEITAFSFGPPSDDAMRERLEKAFEHFIDVSGKSDREIATLARRIEIEIAVDRNGFTEGGRTGIFALRPAPVQVSYLAYPGTMGASYMDYLIADAIVIPPKQRKHFSEKIAYLPDCYQVNDSERQISEKRFTRRDMGLPEKGFVFCCFNNSYKITPDVFDIWMRLLAKTEGSALWLLETNPTATKNLPAEAEARGISGGRLVFAGRMEHSEHLARHALADLALDTFHYNAHTTGSDALWAGLPVLTCLGEAFAGRVAASLLTAAGLPELIAHSHAEYEALALELATHPQKLSAIRQKLTQSRMTCPLFNTRRFTKQFEDALLKMHERHIVGLPCDHIFVTDDIGH